jgi:hypothetical protein
VNDRPDLYFAVGLHWYGHPRFIALKRPTAALLWFALVAWSREHLTDGLVPDAMVAWLAPQVKANARLDRRDLIRVGLLRERKGKVEIHRYLAWQSSATQVEGRRQSARIAGIRSGEARRSRIERPFERIVQRSVERNVEQSREEKRREEKTNAHAREDEEPLVPMPAHLRRGLLNVAAATRDPSAA